MNFKRGFWRRYPQRVLTPPNDCVRGDATLFDRGDSVEAAWSLIEPVLDVCSAAKTASRFPLTRREVGDRRSPTNYSNATGGVV